MRIVFKDQSDSTLSGTLLLPAVAHANVGELAADALITTLRLPFVGAIEDPHVLPCVGNDPYTSSNLGTLVTALELYGDAVSGIYVLQQRSPVIAGLQDKFSFALAAFIRQHDFRSIIILCGFDAQYQQDAQIREVGIRYLSDDYRISRCCQASGSIAMEQSLVEDEQSLHHLLPPWPLLHHLNFQSVKLGDDWEGAAQQNPYSVIVLARLTLEGDNVDDGLELCRNVLNLLNAIGHGVQSVLPVAPLSWSAVYGRSRSLY